MKRTREGLWSTFFDMTNIIFMVFLAVLFVFPFWNLLVMSFSSPEEARSFGFHLFPEKFIFTAYKQVFQTELLYTAYFNTLLRTIGGVVITVFITLFAGYALAKRKLPFRNTIMMIFLLTIFFSGGLIPIYFNIRSLGLMDSLWALILPGAANAWYIILARNFLMTFPEELEESAIIDGANPIKIAIKIIFPLSMPIIAVIALWAAVYHWNAWFDAVIFIRDENKYVLQLLVQKIMQQEQQNVTGVSAIIKPIAGVTSESVKASTIIVSIVPILIMYPFAQKYFVKGVLVGSVKG